MTEEKTKRTLDEITKDHNTQCANAGFFAYRMRCDAAELEKTYQKISDFNREAADLKAAEVEAPKMEVVK